MINILRRRIHRSFVAGVLSLGLFGTAAATPFVVPAYVGKHHGTPADRASIKQLLAAYTDSVSHRDEAVFESLLLNLDIPFAGSWIAKSAGEASPIDTRGYAGFKAAVFHSDRRVRQSFHNVRIEQDNELAQVSLDFMNVDEKSGDISYGWKVLQLLKVGSHWKIASEFFTGYDAPRLDTSAEKMD